MLLATLKCDSDFCVKGGAAAVAVIAAVVSAVISRKAVMQEKQRLQRWLDIEHTQHGVKGDDGEQ